MHIQQAPPPSDFLLEAACSAQSLFQHPCALLIQFELSAFEKKSKACVCVCCVCRNYTADLVWWGALRGVCVVWRRPCPVYWRMTDDCRQTEHATLSRTPVGKMHFPCSRRGRKKQRWWVATNICHQQRLFINERVLLVHIWNFSCSAEGERAATMFVRVRERSLIHMRQSESNCCRWNLNDALELEMMRSTLLCFSCLIAWCGALT